jgi:hypothetical protein
MADVTIPYDELVSRYGKDVADRLVEALAEGYSPYIFRELDPWTGQVHWEYQMPQPTGNVNLWQVPVNADGEADFSRATWVGPGPAPGPTPTPTEFLQGARSDAPPPESSVAIQLPNNSLVIQGQIVTSGSTQPTMVTAPIPTSLPPDSGREVNQPGGQPMVESLDDLIIRRAGGNGNYSWDQWNWFFEQVTGQAAPAPEERGYQRSSDGLVYINGQAYFDFYTWKAHAFPQGFGNIQPLPPGQAPPRTEPPTPGQPPTQKNLVDKLLDFIKMILRMIVAGGK